jgi:hypothetical protein
MGSWLLSSEKEWSSSFGGLYDSKEFHRNLDREREESSSSRTTTTLRGLFDSNEIHTNLEREREVGVPDRNMAETEVSLTSCASTGPVAHSH